MTGELNYLRQFGLSHNPFPVAPDDENFYLSQHIEQIISEVVHGIVARKGFLVLTGDIGLGKTTISRRVIAILEKKQVATSLVFHTAFQDADLLRAINRDFGLDPDRAGGLAEQMGLLNEFLLRRYRESKNCAIIIDDAQNLTPASLELIRMISNLETGGEKLVQILLIGQSELMQRLCTHEMRQLLSRVVIKKQVKPLCAEELKHYILFKLNVAGNNGQLCVHGRAFGRIHRLTRGNFRMVNLLMDRCLYVACLTDQREISTHIVNVAHADLYPQPGWWQGRSWLWTLCILAVLAAGPIVWGARHLRLGLETAGNSNRFETSAAVPAVLSGSDSSPVASVVTPPDSLPPRIRPTLTALNQALPAPPRDHSPLAAFLDAYDLATYLEPLAKALADGNLRDTAELIFDRTGYRLISLERLPDAIRSRWAVLAYQDARDGNERYLLFWKPSLSLDKFYYNYSGPEIRTLQKMLAHLDLYNDRLDSVVGSHLMKAVVAFQTNAGIPVTGYPDDMTLFLICQKAGGIGNG